jgi:hypothetical protein
MDVCLLPLECWGCVFKYHPRHGCLRAFILFVVSCVKAEALLRADPLIQGVLPTVYRIKKAKSGQGPTKGL